MASALQMLTVIWSRCCSKEQGRQKNPPNISTQGFNGLTFSMETISLPPHSQQALLSIGTYLKYPKVSLVIQESAIGGKWDWTITYRCSQCHWLCRTGQRQASLIHVLIFLLAFDFWQTSMLVMVYVFWLCFGMHCPVLFSLSTVLFPHQQTGVWVSLCYGAVATLTQQRETRIRLSRLACDLSSEAGWVSVLTCLIHGPQYLCLLPLVSHYLLQMLTGLCCIIWSRSCYSFGPLLSITIHNEMRLGNTEKFLSTKYLFLVGNNIRNRLNILKAFKKLLKEL